MPDHHRLIGHKSNDFSFGSFANGIGTVRPMARINPQRLTLARTKAGLSQSDLAERIGMAQTGVASIEAGDVARPRKLREIARALNVNQSWLLEEEEDEAGDGEQADALKPLPDQIGIAEVDVRAGAGGGGIPVEHYETDANGNTALTEGVRGHWHLPDNVTREVMHAAPGHLRIFEVIGDSMEPRLFEGDRVFIDTRYRSPAPEGIFALWDGFSVVIKRVQIVRDSEPQRIKIISANSSYDAYEATIDEVNLIGRYAGRLTTR
jgi:phage repressor protein C with HTH and peptisase S24 domain